MEHSEILKNSSEKFKTQMKNSKLKQKTKNSSKKLKVSANPLGLLAENTSKKRLFYIEGYCLKRINITPVLHVSRNRHLPIYVDFLLKFLSF